jgi:Holliday junction resolvasome RuvABC endonuclease subunit
MIVVGLDVSLNSPGFASFNTETNTWNLMCFAQLRRHEQKDTNLGDNVNLTILPRINKNDSDVDRYKRVLDALDEFLQRKPHENHIVFIEGYAFVPASIAGNNYKLRELTGIIKYILQHKHRIDKVEIVAIGKWKKSATGSGRASKRDVINHVKNTHGIALENVFTEGKIDQSKDPPSPAQDLADAMCIVSHGLATTLKPTKPSKKRKKSQKTQKKPRKQKKKKDQHV